MSRVYKPPQKTCYYFREVCEKKLQFILRRIIIFVNWNKNEVYNTMKIFKSWNWSLLNKFRETKLYWDKELCIKMGISYQ